jgi:hypothetical protein
VAQNQVSHHRVDASVHRHAKTKAANESTSMSMIATQGLKKYIAEVSDASLRRARARVASGSLVAEAPTLPRDTTEILGHMAQQEDPLTLMFLVALHNAGWSYASLALPLGISRQGVHLRIAKWKGAVHLDKLPTVPNGSGLTSFPAHPATKNRQNFDWAIWIERDLYAIAAEHARSKNKQMREVMEGILHQYVAGELVIKDSTLDNTASSSRRTRTMRGNK